MCRSLYTQDFHFQGIRKKERKKNNRTNYRTMASSSTSSQSSSTIAIAETAHEFSVPTYSLAATNEQLKQLPSLNDIRQEQKKNPQTKNLLIPSFVDAFNHSRTLLSSENMVLEGQGQKEGGGAGRLGGIISNNNSNISRLASVIAANEETQKRFIQQPSSFNDL